MTYQKMELIICILLNKKVAIDEFFSKELFPHYDNNGNRYICSDEDFKPNWDSRELEDLSSSEEEYELSKACDKQIY